MYNFIIIGGGAAGFSAAIRSNELNAKTLLINSPAIGIGGTCVNVGCLPTKHLLHIADLLYKSKEYCSKSIRVDFRKIIDEKNSLIQKLRKEKYENVLSELNDVDFIEGEAKFLNNNEIQVGNEIYTGRKFLIATGSSPKIPHISGLDQVNFLTNKSILELRKLPKSLVIIGSGPLAIEFAQIYTRFGTDVTLIFRGKRILKREEPELANLLQQYMSEEGINFIGEADSLNVKNEEKKKIVMFRAAGKDKKLKTDQILIATGRLPNTKGINIDQTGVNLGDTGEIIVNEFMQSSVKDIFAAGDVTGEPMLETVAAREGMVAANNAISGSKIEMDYRIVPHSIFTYPGIGSVGLTDERAKRLGIQCKCSTIPFRLLPKANAIGNINGAIKMVVNAKTEEIVGVHILAENAGDMIHEGVMVVKNRMKLNDIIETLHVFPTISEGTKLVAQSFKRDIEKMACCVE